MTRRSLRFVPLFTCFCACVIEDAQPELDTTGAPADSSSSAGDPADSSSDDGTVPTECPAPTSGPTMHAGDNVESDEVWTADGSPHLLPYDFTIYAHVEVEPCATVQLGEGLTLTIGDGGSLDAIGTAEQPIVFERKDDGAWTTIRMLGGTASFAYALLDGGGKTGNTVADLTGALIVRSSDGAVQAQDVLAVSHVEIRGSESAGVRLEGTGSFSADSQDLTITDGGSHPISAAATVVGSIPSGSYTGNADDQIVLTTANTEAISYDATIHDRGVPYYVGLPGQVGDLRVQAGAGGLAVLTIEPGVELRFPKNGVLTIDHDTGEQPASGALVAVGTASQPIVLTSAEAPPQAGDWLGVYFGGVLADDDRMDNVRVEYAGGASSSGSSSCLYPGEPINDAAIRIFGVPPGAFITNTAIVASASHGIDRGWRDDTMVELLTSNDFDVAECEETWSKLSDGSCPDDVPCP